MAGPWEQYTAPQEPAKGPWSDYQAPAEQPATPPQAFIDRMQRGAAVAAAAKPGSPQDMIDSDWERLVEAGIVRDPYTGRPGAVHGAPLVTDKPSAWNQIKTALSSDFNRLVESLKTLPERSFEASEQFRVGEGTAEGAGTMLEAAMFGRTAPTSLPGGVVLARPHMAGDRPMPQDIGPMPRDADFQNAAAGGLQEARLRELWEERGVHPAEAAHDAQADAFLKNDLSRPHFITYHGSPHRFEKFDLSKVGQGEGAQAYGHGLYFAESPHVADTYRDGRLGLSAFSPDGEIQGHLYQVRINANKADFLDWDKPLNEQPPSVRRLVQELDLRETSLGEPATFGSTAYQALKDHFASGKKLPPDENGRYRFDDGREAASRALMEAGVPGIKYLDQRSRQTKEGTHNIVLFDDSLATITHRNGEPLTATEKALYLSAADGGDAAPRSLSAAVAPDLPPVAPITPAAPAPPPGRIIAAAQNAADKALDIGRDIQGLVAPMALGTVESLAIAKDFANTLRRNRWEWSRVDEDIGKRFDPEQRKRMWMAADEESVARQLSESTEHQGLVTLTAPERAAVEDLQGRAQVAWLRARDLGMVEGEGLPAYTPRMILNVAEAATGDGAIPLNGLGYNLKTNAPNLRRRKYTTAEETEAAAKGKYGEQAELARDIRTLPLATAKLEDAVAGRTLINAIKDYGSRTGTDTVAEGAIPAGSETKWFTLDHPAFRTWRPKFKSEDGKVVTVKDAEGNPIFEQVPLYVHGDFEGPLKAVLTTKSGETYKSMMELKGKTMSLIMNSPLIHNAVEFGRAFPAMPSRIVKAYFDGNRAKYDVPLMREAIDNGLVPIGKRFFKQDIDSVMEAPDLTPGRSWTAKVLAAVPGLFDEAAGTAVKRSIDKAGDFWHNTLLWDRIADLQAGLYVNFRSDLVGKGVDQQTSSRIAAHLANRYAGALPKEAMSDAATKVANMMLFSRTFTMGNLGVMKDMLTGMPKDVLSQIERDMGTVNPEAAGYAKSLARRKAMATVALDIGLMYVGNSVLQSAFNVMLGDHELTEEMHGYVRRLRDTMQKVEAHPMTLLQPFGLAESLSATSENEPGRHDRVKIGYAKDGTAIYARNPVGKIGEEFVGYLTSPIDMMRRKEGTIARPALQVFSNDKGFGRKIYDPNAETPAKYAGNIWAIVEHFAKAQVPEGQITALSDLVKGDGDPKVNALQGVGPVAGVTFSKGAPGGQAIGEMYKAREVHDFQVQMAMPDIRKQIQRGDMAGATAKMNELGIPPGLQRFYIRTSQNPATRLGGRTLQDFYRYATPEQRERMERLRSTSPIAAPQ